MSRSAWATRILPTRWKERGNEIAGDPQNQSHRCPFTDFRRGGLCLRAHRCKIRYGQENVSRGVLRKTLPEPAADAVQVAHSSSPRASIDVSKCGYFEQLGPSERTV